MDNEFTSLFTTEICLDFHEGYFYLGGKEPFLMVEGLKDVDINNDTMNMVLAAAADRNKVVYDDQAGPNELSPRLLRFMRRNQKITDVLFDSSVAVPINIFHCNYGVRFRPINTQSWEDVNSYYENDLKGSYPYRKFNLIIGIDLSGTPPLVRLAKDDLTGLAVLDNQKVLLGAV
jgi:hypothetical protein